MEHLAELAPEAEGRVEDAEAAKENAKGTEGQELTLKKRVALLGSSANPPTKSHASIGAHFAKEFDEVWVAPVFRHIFDTKAGLASFEHRMKMAEMTFLPRNINGYENVKVVRVEEEIAKEMGSERPGTYDLLCKLSREYPNVEFTLVLGGDTFHDLVGGKWKSGQEILSKFQIGVFQRSGWKDIDHDALLPNVHLHKVDGLGVHSSTAAREACLKDINQLKNFVVPEVCTYIEEHRLYM